MANETRFRKTAIQAKSRIRCEQLYDYEKGIHWLISQLQRARHPFSLILHLNKLPILMLFSQLVSRHVLVSPNDGATSFVRTCSSSPGVVCMLIPIPCPQYQRSTPRCLTDESSRTSYGIITPAITAHQLSCRLLC